MLTKIISTAAIALAITASAASAQTLGKTERGAGLFDQGGLFYNMNQNNERTTTTRAEYGYQNVDRGTTASIGNGSQVRSNLDRPAVAPSGIPSDTRNERGLGMFDVAN
jgi:hypothetical protein